MLWVGGGIVVHGADEFHLTPIPHLLHEGAEAAGHAVPAVGGVITWLVNAAGAAVVGLVIGGAVILALKAAPEDARKTGALTPVIANVAKQSSTASELLRRVALAMTRRGESKLVDDALDLALDLLAVALQLLSRAFFAHALVVAALLQIARNLIAGAFQLVGELTHFISPDGLI
jgi:hypothetical protein